MLVQRTVLKQGGYSPLRSYSVLWHITAFHYHCARQLTGTEYIYFCRVSCGGVVNMLLVLSITFYFHYNIWGCMCSTGPNQYRWLKGYIYSSCYYRHQIGSIHLSHCYHFPVVVCLRYLLHHILSLIAHTFRENRTLFSLLLCSLRWVQIVGYVLPCRSYSFGCIVHHLIIIIVQTYLKTLNLKSACQIYFVECVSKIKHILSVIQYRIHYIICGAVCFQFTHSPCDDWDNIYTLSYHQQIGSMNYYPFFRVRSWNNGVRCMSFYILVFR